MLMKNVSGNYILVKAFLTTKNALHVLLKLIKMII